MDISEKTRYLYQLLADLDACDVSSTMRPVQIRIPKILGVIKAINKRGDTDIRIKARLDERMKAQRLSKDVKVLAQEIEREQKQKASFVDVTDNIGGKKNQAYVVSQIYEHCKQDVLIIFFEECNQDLIV
jgi:hypothetical protein